MLHSPDARLQRPEYFFSPLYVGSVVVTADGREEPSFKYPFSPLYVGSVVVTLVTGALEYPLPDFQSPTRRVSGCNPQTEHDQAHPGALSVPYTSGQWL